jgi:hypothetical protein
MRQALQAIIDQLAALQEQIGTLERGIRAQHRASEASQRLETIPGIGVIGESSLHPGLDLSSANRTAFTSRDDDDRQPPLLLSSIFQAPTASGNAGLVDAADTPIDCPRACPRQGRSFQLAAPPFHNQGNHFVRWLQQTSDMVRPT